MNEHNKQTPEVRKETNR